MSAISPLGRRFEVLLVEDSAAEARLVKEAFRGINESVNLHCAVDGVDAMDFLNREGPHESATRPDLILLDLNLPKMQGQEVLSRIKCDPELKSIPTIILTSSEMPADIATCYDLHANGYLKKPAEYESFQRLVGYINDFWLTNVLLMRHRDIATD